MKEPFTLSLMNSRYSFHSFHDGVIVLRLKGLGSSMDGGSSWVTCGVPFRTLKDCKNHINSLKGSAFEWILNNELAKAKRLAVAFPQLPVS